MGITARVFQDLGKLQTQAAQTVLDAAVIDDILGLIILAVVSAIVTVGSVSAGIAGAIVFKAVAFLVGAIIVGQLAAPKLSKLFAKIHRGHGMKFTLAISIGLIFAYLAKLIGLEPIVGAFAAGLILDPVHFSDFLRPRMVDRLEDVIARARKVPAQTKQAITDLIEEHSHHHIHDLIEPVAHFLVPIFFVVTGKNVKIDALFDPKIVLVALGVTVAPFIGKIVSGIAAGKGNRLVVGIGMIPRGEVGLIFAAVGQQLGVVSDEVFSVIVVMVILTTLLTPPVLAALLRRQTA